MTAAKPICLWMRCNLANSYTGLLPFLSKQQQNRYKEIGAVDRAAEYLLGRWLCNQLSPLQCEDDRDGLPFLQDAPEKTLNITHSRQGKDLFIAAVIGNGEIGVDGEINSRKRKTAALSKKWFSDSEISWLNASKESEAERFFLLWTAKEAAIKSQRGTLGEQLASTQLDISADGKMSTPELTVSHYHLETDLILAIAHQPANRPAPPLQITTPVNC